LTILTKLRSRFTDLKNKELPLAIKTSLLSLLDRQNQFDRKRDTYDKIVEGYWLLHQKDGAKVLFTDIKQSM